EGLRPKWMLRLGLFLYDNLGGRKLLPGTRTLSLRHPPHADVLQDRLVKGFEYSDCWVQDARLVVLNAMDAKARGAQIRTRTECISLNRDNNCWTVGLRGKDGDTQVTASIVINAAGPWVDTLLDMADPQRDHTNLRLVKGSHLVFPKLFEGRHAYIFQNRDNRIVFAIPYEGDFTLVGTTDVLFTGDPDKVEISDEEKRYICDAVNEYLKLPVSPQDAIWSYSGVRPLYDDHKSDNSTVTRDYVFDLDDTGGAPILSIFGGKITTYRKLAEHALEKLGVVGDPWTANEELPGGDIDPARFDNFFADCMSRYPWFGPEGVRRLCRTYGTKIGAILGQSNGLEDLGPHLGGDLYAAELEYLVEQEFAQNSEDVLWRRSKLGLHLSLAEQKRVSDWFDAHLARN
ncbi:MAG: glycerol-3-phosphate dehydrogenase, partial [Sphingomonadales bacterium]